MNKSDGAPQFPFPTIWDLSVTDLLDKWMTENPTDLLYRQVAILKIKQWIWLMEAGAL